MKKRLLCTILIMVMMFGATVPSYAEAWGTGDVTYVRNSLATIVAQILEINSKMGTIDGNGNSVLDNISLQLAHLESWLVPTGANTGTATLMDSIIVLTNYAMNHLPDISVISGYVVSWMQQNNTYLNTTSITNTQLRDALSNVNYYTNTFNPKTNSQDLLFNHNQDGSISSYWVNIGSIAGSNGYINNNHAFNWVNGTPLGNIAYMLRMVTLNQSNGYHYLWNAGLTDYTGQLGIWDSQGETLTQEAWSPTSAINGLYKYLAYTQRDVARLTYVLASDEEITAREKARENQEAVLDNFVDPEGSGSVSSSNFGDIASASDSFKDNMNTGVSASGIFDVFTGDHTSRWFSTEMANSINNVGSGSRSLKAATPQPTYETPLLDAKMTELLSIFGGDD